MNQPKPRTTGAPPTNDHQQPQPTSTVTLPMVLAIPVVDGTELRPSGDARYPRVNVTHDECGGFVHTHIKFEVDETSIVRSPACAKHREYRIQIINAVPAHPSEGAA